MPDVGQRSEKRQRTELVGVRLTPVEKAQLLETATKFRNECRRTDSMEVPSCLTDTENPMTIRSWISMRLSRISMRGAEHVSPRPPVIARGSSVDVWLNPVLFTRR